MIRISFPSGVTGGNADWHDLNNSLTQDTAPGTWARWDGVDNALNANWVVYEFPPFTGFLVFTGIVIEAYLGATLDGNVFQNEVPGNPPTHRLEIALSKDGINPVGNTYLVDMFQYVDQGYANIRPLVLGDDTELHGVTWELSDFESLFLLVRVPTAASGENTTDGMYRSIEYVKLTVYAEPVDDFINLTGEGFSDGTVNLDWND